MAKTIKELAIEAYPMRELIAYGNIVDALQFQRLAFMEGANAVLELIEQALDEGLSELNTRIGCVKAREVIEQLKAL